MSKEKNLRRQRAQEFARKLRREKKVKRDIDDDFSWLKSEKKITPSEIYRNKNAPILKRIIRQIFIKAPKLLSSRFYLNGVKNLSYMEIIREPEDWKPNGGTSQSIFYSLANFLVANYNIPDFFWTILLSKDANNFIIFLDAVSKGESPYQLVKRNYLTVPFTRRMCHKLMTFPSKFNFNDTVRYIQFKEFDCLDSVYYAFLLTRYGRLSTNLDKEKFIETIIRWLSINCCELDSNMIDPIIDYVAYKKAQDYNFSIKGKTVSSIMKAAIDLCFV